MEFINRMKKREVIEMCLKTVMAILVAFLAIILMEGMIYGIQLHALKTKGTGSTLMQPDKTIAYCIKESKDQYFVVYYNEIEKLDGKTEDQWSAIAKEYKTKQECENLNVKEVVWHAPNAFEFSITPIHYVVMVAFVALVGGYFVYRFVALDKLYKKVIKKFNEDGTIEI